MVACSLWGHNNTLSAYVLDAASGRLVRRFSLDQAAEPVHSLLIENFVLVSYWNPKVVDTCSVVFDRELISFVVNRQRDQSYSSLLYTRDLLANMS